jgi:hypothetical protein
MEKEDWKSFRNALDKSDRKKSDENVWHPYGAWKEKVDRVGFEQLGSFSITVL